MTMRSPLEGRLRDCLPDRDIEGNPSPGLRRNNGREVVVGSLAIRGRPVIKKARGFQKKTDYLVTLIKRVGGYLEEITTS